MKIRIPKYLSLAIVFLGLLGSGCSGSVDNTNKTYTFEEKSQEGGVASQDIESPVYIVRGDERKLCRDVYKLFLVPQNAHYLYTSKQLKELGVSDPLKEWRSNRVLIVPKTNEFKEFNEPVWKDITDTSVLNNLAEFIKFIEEHFGRMDENILLNRDYKIQESLIDMNMDGSPEVVYRSLSQDDGILSVKGSATNFLSINFKKRESLIYPGLFLKGQIILHNGVPSLFNRDIGLEVLRVQPSMENLQILTSLDPRKKFEPLSCAFSSRNNYVGD